MIDNSGKQLGIKSTFEALRMAEDIDLDLVEVGPNGHPPVARIMDYSKYRYELDKKQSKRKRGSEVKEVRLSLGIGEHDWRVRLNQATKFLNDGCKIKITLKLAGRQMLFKDKAIDKMNEFKNALGASYESAPQRFGPRYIAVIIRTNKDEKQD